MNGIAKPIALQMWTVREEANRDFIGTLERVARLGYTGVEQVHSIGYGGLPAAEVRRRLSDLGLETAGTHVSLDEWEADAERAIAFQQELGTRYVAVSWLEPDRRKDEAAYRNVAESIKRIALLCEHADLKLLYHHHDFEFVRFGGHTALDLLSQMVGPEHLGVEVDVHWVKRAGEDPVDFLRQVGPRCPLVHLKDVTAHAENTSDHEDASAFTPVGTGILDFRAIAAAARYAEWYIVEQDYCSGDPFEAARISLENMKQMRLVG